MSRVITKKVYYCDFCNKHGLSGSAMVQHEKRCTLNIGRVCHWDWNYARNTPHPVDLPLKSVVRKLRRWRRLDEKKMNTIRDLLYGCPACMLTALRCSNAFQRFDVYDLEVWDMDKEKELFRDDMRQREEEETRAEIMSGWL